MQPVRVPKDKIKLVRQPCEGCLRIGIGNEFFKGQQAHYVLSEWSPEQKDELPGIIERAANAVLAFGTLPMGQAMNLANADPSDKKA